MSLALSPGGETVHGKCPDCEHVTRTVWGFVSQQDNARAVYYARWTDGHLERGAQLIICIGMWGEGRSGADRKTFGLECQIVDGEPAFMFVDAGELPWNEPFLGELLPRETALASQDKTEVLNIVDMMIESDPRVVRFLRNIEAPDRS